MLDIHANNMITGAANSTVGGDASAREKTAKMRLNYSYGDNQARQSLWDVIEDRAELSIDYVPEQYRDSAGRGVTTLDDGRRHMHAYSSGSDDFDVWLAESTTLQHEAYRDGVIGSEVAQDLETYLATAAHTDMALRLAQDYGYGFLSGDRNLAMDVTARYYANQGKLSFRDYVENTYDSSADYWKLTGEGKVIYDGRADLRDENGHILVAGERDGKGNELVWQSLIKFMGEDGAREFLGLKAGEKKSCAEMSKMLQSRYYDNSHDFLKGGLQVRDELFGLRIGAEGIINQLNPELKAALGLSDPKSKSYLFYENQFIKALPGMMEVADIADMTKTYYKDGELITEHCTPAEYFNENIVSMKINGQNKYVLRNDVALWEKFDGILNKYQATGESISISGPWSVREERGWPGYTSNHSFPCAIDINPNENGQYIFNNMPIDQTLKKGNLTGNEFVTIVQALSGIDLRNTGFSQKSDWFTVGQILNAASDQFEALSVEGNTWIENQLSAYVSAQNALTIYLKDPAKVDIQALLKVGILANEQNVSEQLSTYIECEKTMYNLLNDKEKVKSLKKYAKSGFFSQNPYMLKEIQNIGFKDFGALWKTSLDGMHFEMYKPRIKRWR